MSVRRLTTCAMLLAALLGVCAEARAQNVTAFRDGIKARNDRKWDDAVRLMRAAIQNDANESPEKVRITGVAFISFDSVEYLPHFFLGEALLAKGDCLGAVNEWEESERQGVVRRRSDFFAILQRGYATCAAKGVLPPSELRTAIQRADMAIDAAGTARARVTDRNAEQNLVWRQTAGLQEQFQRAESDYDASQAKLTAGRRSRSLQDLNEARAAAERAGDGFVRVRVELDAAVDQYSRLQAQLQGLVRALAAADAIDAEIDPLLARVQGAKLPLSTGAIRARARESLSRARDLTAGRDAAAPAALAESVRVVQEATLVLTGLRDQAAKLASQALEGERNRLLSAADEALAFVQRGMATVDRVWTQTGGALGPDAARDRDSARRQFDAAARRLADARRAGDVARIREATGGLSSAQRLIETWVTTFSDVRLSLEDRGIPPALVSGARSFLKGDYQAALGALDDASLLSDQAPLRIHTHLFRAASLFALFVRGGERDQGLRDRARAEVQACKGMDPALQPDARAFAPRFLAFFADVPPPQ